MSSSEAFFVEHALRSLKAGGRAVVLLPLGFLARRSGEAIYRADLVRRGRIEGVVALPGGVIPWTELPTAILVLRGHDAPRAAIRLVELTKNASTRLACPPRKRRSFMTRSQLWRKLDRFADWLDAKMLRFGDWLFGRETSEKLFGPHPYPG